MTDGEVWASWCCWCRCSRHGASCDTVPLRGQRPESTPAVENRCHRVAFTRLILFISLSSSSEVEGTVGTVHSPMLLLTVTHLSILSAIATPVSHFRNAIFIPALETFLQAPRPSSHRRSVDLLARALIIRSRVDWCEPPKTCLPITQAHRESYQGHPADQHATLNRYASGIVALRRCKARLGRSSPVFCPPLLTPASFPFTFGIRSISCCSELLIHVWTFFSCCAVVRARRLCF